MLLHTALKWFSILHLLHFYHTLVTTSVGALCHNIYSSLSISSLLYSLLMDILTWSCISLCTESKSFASLILSNTAFFALCTSTLWAYTKTCSLLALMVSFMAVSFFIMSSLMVTSFRPFMKFSSVFCYISDTLAFTHSLPIHPCLDSSLVFSRKDLCDARVKPKMSSYFQMKCTAQVYPLVVTSGGQEHIFR